MVGQVDRLDVNRAVGHWKSEGLDFSDLLHRPDVPHAIYCCEKQTLDEDLESVLDMKLLELAKPAIERGEAVDIELPIRNTDRTVGTILGSEISLAHGAEGLPEDTVRLRFKGSAGQSLAAFCTSGMTFEVEGDANDYCGKGLCGGKLIVRVPPEATFDPSSNVIAGNVLLYGATGGEAYFQGVVGERFCVRNSGATAVVEGVGDHGLEYMTGGIAVVLGETGRNFAAGMSGGIAYVLDDSGDFASRVNHTTVDLDPLGADDEAELRALLEKYVGYTGSAKAQAILETEGGFAGKFVKVFPRDYKRALGDRIAAESGNG